MDINTTDHQIELTMDERRDLDLPPSLEVWPLGRAVELLEVVDDKVHYNLRELPSSLDQHRQYGRLRTMQLFLRDLTDDNIDK